MSQSEKKRPSRNPKIEFDLLQCYFGEPYVIDVEDADGTITIYEPTVGDIIEFGEKRWYANLSPYVSNTTTYRYVLNQSGIDWNTLSDFELFCELYKTVEPEFNEIVFKLDISKFEKYVRQITNEDGSVTNKPVLYNEELGIEINEMVYFHISQYLRTCFGSEPKEQITKDPFLKDWYIQKDEKEIKNEEWKKEHGKEKNNSLLPVISGVLNHPGFKYKSSELKELPIFQFTDSVQRLQIIESTTALLIGANSGMADHSKTDPELFNFMREI